jgi:hypothetical protein
MNIGCVIATIFQLIWLSRYSWNIVESGVKHYNLNPNLEFILSCILSFQFIVNYMVNCIILASRYFNDFLAGGTCLIVVCVILAISQTDVVNFGTIRNRWCSHFVDITLLKKIIIHRRRYRGNKSKQHNWKHRRNCI